MVINSYHPGYRWSDAEADGVIETIHRSFPDAHVYLEYLDTKRVPLEEANRAYFVQTAELFKVKFRNASIDLVVVLDNDALEFLNQYGDRIWKNIPTVFCGVEEFSSKMIDRLPDTTGVLQKMDFAGTIKIARQLMPNMKKIWVINEHSSTGERMRRDLERVPAELLKGVTLEYPPPESFPSLLEKSRLLGSDTAILFVVLARDLNGKVMEPVVFLNQLCKETPAPIFVVSEDRLLPGVVGGALLSGRAHGQAAGELAVKVLKEGSTASVPMIREASYVISLDYPQMQRYSWSPEKLQGDIRVLNRPRDLIERYPILFKVTIPVTLSLAFFIILLLLNIQRRRSVERALRESEMKYRQLFSSMAEGVALCEFIVEENVAVDYRILEANPACLKLLGMTQEKVGQTAREIWRGKEVPFLGFFEAMRQKGGEWIGEVGFGGGMRTFWANAFPIDLLRFATVFEDISDRKKAERALHETLNTLNAVIFASPSPIVAFDEDFRISLWNRSAERTFGFMSTEVLGRFLPFSDDEKRPGFQELVRRALKSLPPRFDYEVCLSDGTRQTFLVSVGELSDSVGKVIGTLGIFLDLTEARKTESERKRLVDQLQQVQKLEALGRLAGGIAHDFNNQLTTIIGNSEMLKDEVRKNPETLSLVQEILDAGKRSGALTEQLLTFSRRQMVAPQVIDANKVIVKLKQTLGRLLGEQIRLRFEEMTSDCFIRVDSGLFEQAIMNLAINSRDAMPHGGLLEFRTSHLMLRQVVKSYACDIPPGEYVVVEIADTGHGMDSHVLANLFDPFFTTKPIGKGTGLGLAMVYGFVNQHHGFVHVESQENVGTRFSLYFSSEKRPIEEIHPVQVDMKRDFPRGMILVVEDDPSVRILMQRILQTSGFEVIVTHDGAEALEVFSKSESMIDLVLTDVLMPGMSGFELAKKLWAIRPDLKVIFSSGHGDQNLETEQFSPEYFRVIGKPFPTDQLLNLIRAFLDKPSTSFD